MIRLSIPPLSLPLLTLVLSATLLAAELPYVLAQGTVLPRVEEVEAIESSRIARPDDMQPLLTAWFSASHLFPDPRLKADLALVELAAAQIDPDTPEATWQRIAQDMTDALTARPQDPFTWARLSFVQARLNQTEAARASLVRSFTTGRYLPGFMEWRFAHALTLWDSLTEDERARLGDQAGILWRKKKWNLIKLGRLAPFAVPIETLMRSYQPDSLQAFLTLRKRLPKVGYIPNPG